MTVFAAILSACVGPDFQRPPKPQADRYTNTPLSSLSLGASESAISAQQFLMERDLAASWWTLFRSQELDDLVDAAFRANPNVASAQAALRQAMENTEAQRGSYFPTVQGSFASSRNRDATGVVQPTLASGSPIYSLFTPQVTISYVPDIFGGNRRAVESLEAQAEASRFQLDATYLTLAANVVTSTIQQAGLKEQIAATERMVAFERESLGILRHELELGAIAELDVYAQEAALAQLEGALPPLNKQLLLAQDQLAALTGQLPADFAAVKIELAQLSLPLELSLGVPSQLVERRPDVRAAEAQLHSATAQVGVVIANLLPQVTLTGDLGSTATLLGDLLKSGTGFWSLGANASQTVFAGSTLIHRKRAAEAAVDQAAAQYRNVVLTAFQNVADALHALETDGQALIAAARAREAAEKVLGVSRYQLKLGSIGYLAVLNAQQIYQQAAIAYVQAESNRYADTAALFQALGGAVVPTAATTMRF